VLLPQGVATVRRELREKLKDLIDQIDALVLELFEVKVEARPFLNSTMKVAKGYEAQPRTIYELVTELSCR
jgi:hypothetical protein